MLPPVNVACAAVTSTTALLKSIISVVVHDPVYVIILSLILSVHPLNLYTLSLTTVSYVDVYLVSLAAIALSLLLYVFPLSGIVSVEGALVHS